MYYGSSVFTNWEIIQSKWEDVKPSWGIRKSDNYPCENWSYGLGFRAYRLLKMREKVDETWRIKNCSYKIRLT